MASIDIKHQCGCGYITSKLEEAVRHADGKKHTLTTLGTITPESK